MINCQIPKEEIQSGQSWLAPLGSLLWKPSPTSTPPPHSAVKRPSIHPQVPDYVCPTEAWSPAGWVKLNSSFDSTYQFYYDS